MFNLQLFLHKPPTYMFDRVQNTPLYWVPKPGMLFWDLKSKEISKLREEY